MGVGDLVLRAGESSDSCWRHFKISTHIETYGTLPAFDLLSCNPLYMNLHLPDPVRSPRHERRGEVRLDLTRLSIRYTQDEIPHELCDDDLYL
jgi:hypothetical protein